MKKRCKVHRIPDSQLTFLQDLMDNPQDDMKGRWRTVVYVCERCKVSFPPLPQRKTKK